MFDGLPRFYFPVMWFEVYGTLPKILIIALRVLLKMTLTLTVIGAIMLFSGIIILIKFYYPSKLHIPSKLERKQELELLNSTDSN